MGVRQQLTQGAAHPSSATWWQATVFTCNAASFDQTLMNRVQDNIPNIWQVQPEFMLTYASAHLNLLFSELCWISNPWLSLALKLAMIMCPQLHAGTAWNCNHSLHWLIKESVRLLTRFMCANFPYYKLTICPTSSWQKSELLCQLYSKSFLTLGGTQDSGTSLVKNPL